MFGFVSVSVSCLSSCKIFKSTSKRNLFSRIAALTLTWSSREGIHVFHPGHP
ncbi:hypothetical protein HanRHA438_Chr14g0672191 [Helianthus annuus]|nr:hypothetical protein HanRHA438_Chr14g0672191 [Helianthus annuus]